MSSTSGYTMFTSHLGQEIFVDTTGRFSTILSNGARFEDRSLPKVRKAIEGDEPTIKVMEIQGGGARWGKSVQPRFITRSQFNNLQQGYYGAKNVVDGRLVSYAEYDQTIIDQIAKLDGDKYKEEQEIAAKHIAIRDALFASVERITVDRANELLDEDAKKKAARK